MNVPFELTTRNVERSAILEEFVARGLARLETVCDHISSCRMVVERPHKHAKSGNPFRVRLDITIPPRHEIVVSKDPGDHELFDELPTVINNAFLAAERQLRELVQRQRDEVKTRQEARAIVVRKFPDGGYGFLKTADGREIYFHRNAVPHGAFDRLSVGTEVRIEESMGEEGPQATTVQIVDKPGERAGKGGEEVIPAPAGWES